MTKAVIAAARAESVKNGGMVSIINIFAGSVSIKWAMLAGIIIPMMALLGYHPDYAQYIYRVGDALTNSDRHADPLVCDGLEFRTDGSGHALVSGTITCTLRAQVTDFNKYQEKGKGGSLFDNRNGIHISGIPVSDVKTGHLSVGRDICNLQKGPLQDKSDRSIPVSLRNQP